MEKNSFVFYLSFDEALRELPEKSRLRLYDAITDYALRGKDTVFTGIEKAVFSLIKPQLQANNQRYENGCKGAEFGKLGGRPKKPQEPPKGDISLSPNETPRKPQKNPKGDIVENANETPNENENENVNENVIPPLYPPQVGKGENFQKKFFLTYCQFKKFSNGSYPNIDFEKLLFEFDKSAQLRKTFSWQVILDSYDGIIAGNFRDKEKSNPFAGIEARAERERWYSERKAKAEAEAEKIYKRFMQDETFKATEKRLKQLLVEIPREELVVSSGESKTPNKLVKLRLEQSQLSAKRNGIIERNGMTEEDLLPKWHCKHCKDTGFLEDGKACGCYDSRG